MKCNKLINHIDYKYLQGSNDPWYCISCCDVIFPFGTLNKNLSFDKKRYSLLKTVIHRYINKNSSLSLKPSNLSLLFNQFNNFSPEQKNYSENVVNSNYFDIYQHQNLKITEKKILSYPPVSHKCICSLTKNFEDIEHLVKCTNKVVDIM